MSESEKKRRLEYRLKRKKLILIQSIIAVVLGLAIVISSVVYFRVNSNDYVSYNERSTIDYQVYLKPNNEYEEEFLGKDQSYIASIIDHVDITFNYAIDLDSEWANYLGSYYLDAKLEIRDNLYKKVIYAHTYQLKDVVTFEHCGNNQLVIAEQITIDYDTYNDFANNFKDVYGLNDVTCFLDVAMHVDTDGQCEEFETADFGACSFSLNIPLTKKTIEINMLSSIPSDRQSQITCEECFNKNLFKYIALVGLGLEVVALVVLFIYAYKTRNHDINYEIKIKRLVSSYKSYVQKIMNEFCYDGYRVLKVETFNEMLDIRDTVNSPILMSENIDKTCTKFLIPTDNNILYVHEIRVEDYDEIYADKNLEETEN